MRLLLVPRRRRACPIPSPLDTRPQLVPSPRDERRALGPFALLGAVAVVAGYAIAGPALRRDAAPHTAAPAVAITV
ncbi:MAG: hypothetical protein AB1416_10490, partial [Actinomycetota bacterium]